MLSGWFIILASFAYIGLLFAIAYYGDKRADAGRGIINNPYIYSLSIAVYATTWTFYGSVGRFDFYYHLSWSNPDVCRLVVFAAKNSAYQ